MNILNKINGLYSKYLYAVIPLTTLILAGFEVFYEINNGDIMHILANIFMGFVSLAFCGFYLMSGKQKISYCLIELYLFAYTVFLALDNHLHFSNIVWMIFLPCAIFCMFFILFFNRKTK
ncbi:MAG TPA: hypothetical protein PLG87_09350 [Treponemataceae bacterium]|nr:hypothetical protein [Treponemataceae bacterium]